MASLDATFTIHLRTTHLRLDAEPITDDMATMVDDLRTVGPLPRDTLMLMINKAAAEMAKRNDEQFMRVMRSGALF